MGHHALYSSTEAGLIKPQYILHIKSPPPPTSNLCWHLHISLILILNVILQRDCITVEQADNPKTGSLPSFAIWSYTSMYTHLFIKHRQKTNPKLQLLRKKKKGKKKLFKKSQPFAGAEIKQSPRAAL